MQSFVLQLSDTSKTLFQGFVLCHFRFHSKKQDYAVPFHILVRRLCDTSKRLFYNLYDYNILYHAEKVPLRILPA